MQVIRLNKELQFITPPCILLSPHKYSWHFKNCLIDFSGASIGEYTWVEANRPVIMMTFPISIHGINYYNCIRINSHNTDTLYYASLGYDGHAYH
jgi:hypothetical protein